MERYHLGITSSSEAQNMIDKFTTEQLKMVNEFLEIDYWQRMTEPTR